MQQLFKHNRDLAWYVLRRDLLRIVGYLIWLALWIGGALSYNHNHASYPDSLLILGWRMVFLLIAVAGSGFFLFRLHRFFFDRTCRGRIESSSLSHSYSASSDPGQGGEYDFRLNTKLRLRLSDGKLRRLRFEQKNGFYRYYHEGGHLIKIHGLPYPIRLDASPDDGFVCAACGRISEQKIDVCPACRHSMIDPQELTEEA